MRVCACVCACASVCTRMCVCVSERVFFFFVSWQARKEFKVWPAIPTMNPWLVVVAVVQLKRTRSPSPTSADKTTPGTGSKAVPVPRSKKVRPASQPVASTSTEPPPKLTELIDQAARRSTQLEQRRAHSTPTHIRTDCDSLFKEIAKQQKCAQTNQGVQGLIEEASGLKAKLQQSKDLCELLESTAHKAASKLTGSQAQNDPGTIGDRDEAWKKYHEACAEHSGNCRKRHKTLGGVATSQNAILQTLGQHGHRQLPLPATTAPERSAPSSEGALGKLVEEASVAQRATDEAAVELAQALRKFVTCCDDERSTYAPVVHHHQQLTQQLRDSSGASLMASIFKPK